MENRADFLTNPMQSKREDTCGAHCRSTGKPCQNYKMPNGRCRMHGGKSTGRPITSGNYTKEAKEEMKQIRQLGKILRQMDDLLN
jgi:hypothetical protein